MKHKKPLLLIALLGALAGLMLAAYPALARRNAVSRGEAMSLLHAWTTGRNAVRLNEGIGAGQFDANFADVALPPFASFDGKHYCADDHVLSALAWYNTTADNYQDAKASLDTVTQTIIIDGQPYDTIRTPVRRAEQSTFGGVVHGFSEGVILAPGDLSPGMHSLDVPVYFDGVLIVTLSISFYIDASGTGVCL